jgi:signal transduction histidine kinase
MVNIQNKYFKVIYKPLSDDKSIVILYDITELKKQYNYTKEILNAQQDFTIVTNGKEVKQMNKTALKFFGYKTVKEFIKENNCICDSFIEGDGYLTKKVDGKIWLEIIIENLKNKALVKIKDLDNNIHTFQINTTGKKIEDEYYIVTFTDITLLKLNFEQLESQSKFASMGERISMIAHQWRQPLTIMSSSNSSLKIKKEMGVLQDTEIDDTIDIQSEQIKYMITTMEDFLKFFKNSNTKELITVESIVSVPYKLTESLFKKHNIDFVYDYQIPKNTEILIMQSKLSQVIINLYKNSVDEIVSQNQEDGKIVVSVIEDNDNIIFKFLDNAGGIEEHIINKIFNPYFSTKEENGNGIGLYMSKAIVENDLNGTIFAYNQDDGACFEILIPKK